MQNSYFLGFSHHPSGNGQVSTKFTLVSSDEQKERGGPRYKQPVMKPVYHDGGFTNPDICGNNMEWSAIENKN